MKQLLTRHLILAVSLLSVTAVTFADSPSISLNDLKQKITKPQFQNESFDSESILKSRYVSWGVQPENQSSSINIVDAWKKFEGKKEIVVAVIDTGIDPTHPFLKDNLYTKNGSASATNYGIDFSKSTKNKLQPIDTHGHGTHVSGIIKSE